MIRTWVARAHADRVFISEYIDATKDDEGDYCPKFDVLKPANDICVPGLAREEFIWVDTVVEAALNQMVSFNAGRNGWTLVDGIYDAYQGHGICADDSYVVGLLAETWVREGNKNGAVHPNLKGHAVYRDRLLAKLLPSLYPPNPGETANLDPRDFRNWVLGHAPRLPQQAPFAHAGGPYTVDEGSTVQTANASFDDGTFSSHWISGNSAVATVHPADARDTTITGVDDGTTVITVEVTDDQGNFANAHTEVTVTNVAPTLDSVVAPLAPVAAGSPVTATSAYADLGADEHTLTWAWGDGTTTVEQRPAGAGGAVSATHSYAAAGLYTITLTVDDGDGGTATQSFEYVVVYQPGAGFVTGGGVIESPAGALIADPQAAGPAQFSFVAKYQKGKTVPDGSTSFRFRAGEFTLASTSYEWLVVSGSDKAQYKWRATINGEAGFGFMLSVVDADARSKSTTDRLRLKVWRISDGAVVYDNQLGATDAAEPSTAVSAGQVTVHSG